MPTFGRLHQLCITAGMAMMVVFATSGVSALTLSSTVPQSGHTGFITLASPAIGASPYDFTAQNYLALLSIDSLSVTLTIAGGDTAVGESDYNNLSLALDGIDTGIALNGFPDQVTQTLTITGIPANVAAILAELHSDGKLIGTVKDHTAGDNFIMIPAAFQTTLVLRAYTHPLPEPGTLGLLTLGLSGLGLYCRRKKPPLA